MRLTGAYGLGKTQVPVSSCRYQKSLQFRKANPAALRVHREPHTTIWLKRGCFLTLPHKDAATRHIGCGVLAITASPDLPAHDGGGVGDPLTTRVLEREFKIGFPLRTNSLPTASDR